MDEAADEWFDVRRRFASGTTERERDSMAVTDHPLTESGDSANPRAIEAAARADLDGPVSIDEIIGATLIDIELTQIYARDCLDIQFGDSDV